MDIVVSDAAAPLAGGIDVGDLHAHAELVRKRAHAPYSHFAVGAALVTASGEVVHGTNVENASYGLTVCAERCAVFRAVSEGHRSFQAIAVAGDTSRARTLSCCGACLQVLAEFNPDGDLLVAFPDDDRLRVVCLHELLPVRFRLREP